MPTIEGLRPPDLDLRICPGFGNRSASYRYGVGSPRAMRRTTVLLPGVAGSVGLAVAISNGDTWQRTLVTTVIYGGAGLLAVALVAVSPQRRRAEPRQNGSAHGYDASPRERP